MRVPQTPAELAAWILVKRSELEALAHPYSGSMPKGWGSCMDRLGRRCALLLTQTSKYEVPQAIRNVARQAHGDLDTARKMIIQAKLTHGQLELFA